MAATDTPAAPLATRPGALDLDRLTVIGVAGAPGAMRALVREPRGRVRTVTAGDRLRPGRVLRVEPRGLVIETRQGPALLPLAAPG
ncbi:hypothetical protein DLJ49_13595 [Rhodovulum sp. 12E13]|uniref:hypothetical protein n=1 Tax=Rhodovulum sp. 12E13 TaxID=2203891 RepID=UPI000E16D046|nr:hypothetical protein [Rhodovulum sp. 12E13]RDC71671.1 hypothetical protein DLJ49_13595 [Rhodovulum sp. 12E13]